MASVCTLVYCLSTLFHRSEFAYCFLQNMFYLRHYLILSSARYWLIHTFADPNHFSFTHCYVFVALLSLKYKGNLLSSQLPCLLRLLYFQSPGEHQSIVLGLVLLFHKSFHSLFSCFTCCHLCVASQVALVVKNLPANAGEVRDSSLIPGSGRPPGGGHGNPLWYSYLENPMDRGAWRATTP